MLWNRLSYAMALWMAGSLSACAATPPAENKCPAFQGKHALVSADVFDGPPAEKADLVPDASTGSADHATSTWEVGYLFDSGRKLFLVCKYAGLSDAEAVTVKIEKKVQHCVFRTHGKGRPAELACK